MTRVFVTATCSLLVSLSLGLPSMALANDFPTHDRVEYVFGCMREHGGENYDTLYGCSCKLDLIAKSLSYEEYNEAETFRQLRRTAGERGSLFRDPPRADMLRDKLAEVSERAERGCFPSRS